jgi:hypothetical protein
MRRKLSDGVERGVSVVAQVALIAAADASMIRSENRSDIIVPLSLPRLASVTRRRANKSYLTLLRSV